MDSPTLLNDISNYLKGVDINLDITASIDKKVEQMTDQLCCCLVQRILPLPKYVRYNFVWVACRDNLHAFAQLMVLTGQLLKQGIVRLATNSIMKPLQES